MDKKAILKQLEKLKENAKNDEVRANIQRKIDALEQGKTVEK